MIGPNYELQKVPIDSVRFLVDLCKPKQKNQHNLLVEISIDVFSCNLASSAIFYVCAFLLMFLWF